jgi:acetyltransferase AlgX (SGNH hydrolase-like protein)
MNRARSSVSPDRSLRRCAAAFAVALAGGVAAVAQVAPAAPAAPAAAPAAAPSPADLRAARLAVQQKELDRSLAAVRAFGHGDEFMTAVKKLVAAAGDSKWIPVSDGFLPLVAAQRYVEWCAPLSSSRSEPVAVDWEQPGHPGPVIVDLARQLREHGVEFLCVTIPSRLQLYPELVIPDLVNELKPDEKFAGMVEANTRFLQELTRQGVEVVDLAPAFAAARHVKGDDGDLLYLRFNLHWTPRGAELAAKVVAERVRAQPWFKPGVWQEGKFFEVVQRKFTFKSDSEAQAPNAPNEAVVADVVKPRTGPPNRIEKLDSPIVLLGDSFATTHDEWSAGFGSHLERFTTWPVDLIAPNGGAEIACRSALARRPAPLKGKQVVIWLLQEPNLRLMQQFKPVEIVAK